MTHNPEWPLLAHGHTHPDPLLRMQVRERFDERVAQLYTDLDGGFTALAWFLPAWMPFPSFRTRDRAQAELARRFKQGTLTLIVLQSSL